MFFNLLSLVLLLCLQIIAPDIEILKFQGELIKWILALFICGYPAFNGATWFLTCLFTTEVIFFILTPYVRNNFRLILSIIMFAITGYLIVPLLEHPSFHVKILKYFWYFPSALTALVFFQAGVLTNRLSKKNIVNTKKKKLFCLVLTGTMIALTFNLNHPAYEGYWKAQYIDHLNYGNFFWFYISSFSGIAFIICGSTFLTENKIIMFLGRNTLPLLGLNGIFLHYVNLPIALYIAEKIIDINFLFFNMITISITILQIVLCYPFIKIINDSLKFCVTMVHSINSIPQRMYNIFVTKNNNIVKY